MNFVEWNILYRDLLFAPGELPGSREVVGVPGDLLEHPVGVVHLLLLDLLLKEALVVEAIFFFDVIHSGCDLSQDKTIDLKYIPGKRISNLNVFQFYWEALSHLSHRTEARALGVKGSTSHWAF